MRRSRLQHLVAPVTILAASFWTASIPLLSSLEQLFHTTSPYSKRGLTNEKYMRSRLLRDKTYFKERRMPILCQDLSTMIDICVAHFASSERVSPRCLWDLTCVTGTSFMNRSGCGFITFT
ncbi:hypothetical protein DPMN_022105 [Dreissena polymorpha]|uniref:Uncharacterized protein n=1 Tax=Dreissena polymorpha TaxID=45954 RepID=A0A9D4NPZ0_DREPO|nr:hypothetical protein DPMN_022105 [Dreissena polymorpha]